LKHGDDDILTNPDTIKNHLVCYNNSTFNTDNNFFLDNDLVEKAIPNMHNETVNDI